MYCHFRRGPDARREHLPQPVHLNGIPLGHRVRSTEVSNGLALSCNTHKADRNTLAHDTQPASLR